jgi:hypothetical protein
MSKINVKKKATKVMSKTLKIETPGVTSQAQIGRNILDTRDILNQKFSELFLSELVATKRLDREAAINLSTKVQEILHEQTDRLIDRVLGTR